MSEDTVDMSALPVLEFFAGVILARSEVAQGPEDLGGRVRRQLPPKEVRRPLKAFEYLHRDSLAELVAPGRFLTVSNLLIQWFV